MGGAKGHWGLRLIAGFKLFKSILLFGAGFGLWSLFGRNLASFLDHLVHVFNADPHNHLFQMVVGRVLKLSPQLPLLTAAVFVYGMLFLIEGIGLWLRKRWAEWLTAIVTASFVPFEIYELIRHTTWIKGAALVLNIVIVVYICIRLKTDKPHAGTIQH